MRHLSLLVISVVALVSFLTGQTPRPETGMIQGTISRSGSGEPLSGVEVRIVDRDALPSLRKIIETEINGGNPLTGMSDDDVIALARDAPDNFRGLSGLPNIETAMAGLQKVVFTDNGGHFLFSDVRPGQYTVRAQKAGFFGGTANSANYTVATAGVTVAAGSMANVDLAMLTGTTISGRVLLKGMPLIGVNVQAFAIGFENGYQILKAAVSKPTDDHGDYRLFYLPPGEYVVAVVPRQNTLRVTSPGNEPPGNPAPAPASSDQPLRTFYPGTTDVASAVSVTVQGTGEVAGINITMQTARTYRVSGEIRTTIPPETFAQQPVAIERGLSTRLTGPPTITAQLGFALHDPNVPDAEGGMSLGGAIPIISSGKAVSGRFEVTGVSPGSYDWRAYVDQPTEDGTFVTTAIVPIEVGNSDVENLQLEIHPLVRVRGVVTVDDHAPGDTPVKLSLQVEGSAAKRPGFISIASRVVTAKKEDGTFMIPGVSEGRFRVMLTSGLAPDLYISDVRQGAASVFDKGFEVGKETLDPLQVMLRSGAGTIAGVVQNAAQKPVAGATVTIVPPPSLRTNRARFQSAISDARGRFTLTNIIPGDYKIFAWPDAPGGAYFNARFLSRYEDFGQPIRVGSGASSTVDLVAIP